jgi:hypothetical protein
MRSAIDNNFEECFAGWNLLRIVNFDGGVAGLEDGEGGGMGVQGHFHGGGVVGGWGGVHF